MNDKTSSPETGAHLMPDLAVALRYDEGLPAPIIVAKGSGHMAGRIRALATEASVPIVRNDVAAAGLEPLDIGEFVPPAYWEIVASILVFIRKVRK